MEKKPKQTEQRLSIDKIKCSKDVQPRVKTDASVVKEYAERIEAGDDLPLIVVFYDGTTYWLAEGWHRLAAHKLLGHKMIVCIVIDGTKEDAQWAALQSNRDHGLRRTNADKQRAVEMALEHPDGKDLTDRKIADLVGVSPTMVGQCRKELEPTVQDGQSKKRKGRDGRVTNVASIGKGKKGNGKKAKAKPQPKAIAPQESTPATQAETLATNNEPATQDAPAVGEQVLAVSDVPSTPAAEGTEEENLVATYHRMLTTLPGELDKLAAQAPRIAGTAMNSEAAVEAIDSIFDPLIILQDVEERLVKNAGNNTPCAS